MKLVHIFAHEKIYYYPFSLIIMTQMSLERHLTNGKMLNIWNNSLKNIREIYKMKSEKEILDKLNQIIVDEPNKWLEDADYRFENKAWLRKSQAIALKILTHIHAHGMSQKDLADRLNVAPQQVNRWVKGGENFTLETISKIEMVLGIQLIDVSDKLERKESPISVNNADMIETDSVFSMP